MKRWLFLALVFVACSSKHYDDDDDGGASGDAGAGGSSAGGKGGSGSSGASAKGGSGASTSMGGSNGEGGADVGGGTTAGGGTSVGGDLSIGGAGDTGMPNGGEPPAEGGSGGTSGGTGGSNGGTSGTGGSVGGTGGSMAGTGGTGGSAGQGSAGCDSVLSVSDDGYVRMPAKGACWHGYAISGGDNNPSTSVYPETWDTCGADCQLAIAGTVAGGNGSTYAYLAFGLNQATGGGTWNTVTPTGTGIKITHTYTSALKAYIELTSSTADYCVELPASGTTIPYSSFKTQCWDSTGTAYAKSPIDGIQVKIDGASEPGDFNLHITNVEEI